MSGKRERKKLKALPTFASDGEAERFVERSDVTKFDLPKGRAMRFEFDRKAKQTNLRMPEGLLASVKLHAKRRGIAFQWFIREVLEQALGWRVGSLGN